MMGARFGPLPLRSYKPLFVFVSAAAPISVLISTEKFARRRKRKAIERSCCWPVKAKGLVGLPSS